MAGAYEVIIFAAGFGKRLGMNMPKALVPVCGRPILSRQLAAVREVLPGATIHVVGGYQFPEVKAFLARDFPDPNILLHRNPFFTDLGIMSTAWVGRQHVVAPNILRFDGDVVIDAAEIARMVASPETTFLMSTASKKGRTAVMVLAGARMGPISLIDDYTGPHEWACIELYRGSEYQGIVDHHVDKNSEFNGFYFQAVNAYFAETGRPWPLHLAVAQCWEIDTHADLQVAELALAGKEKCS